MIAESILIVDDSEQNLLLLEGNLSSSGYAVQMAHSGPEAIEKFKQQTPDLVLLDVIMPGMDGFEACRQIRALPNGADVPIIFLTALSDIQSHKQALDAGGDDLITKPIQRTELLLRVRSMLWMRHLRAELRSGYNLLSSQRDTLIRVQKQKEQLAEFIVHDLKNPLGNIVACTTVIAQSKSVQQDAEISTLAHLTLESATSMERMIYNLLDITKGEDGMLAAKKEPIEVNFLIEQITKSIEANAKLQGVKLVISKPDDLTTIHADGDLLKRVLENLASNALRYSPPQANIFVDFKRLDENSLEIRVRDQGIGIPSEYREKIFEKYVQLENESMGHNQGLGLTFCRMAIEAQGGRIWAENNKPAGASLCLQLPALKP